MEMIVEEDNTVTIANIVKFSNNNLDSVQRLIRKNRDDLLEFGNLGIYKDSDFKSVHLNEPQTYFLLTLMRNNKVVTEFKKKLIQQFFYMRDKMQREKETTISFLKQINKKRSEHIYAKPRENGFETVTHIIRKYELDTTPEYINNLLMEKDVIGKVEVVSMKPVANGKHSIISDGSIVVHEDTALDIIKADGIKVKNENQQRMDFG